MLTTLEMILRLGSAAAVGAVLGWEREAQKKPAGLRTHLLVSLGSAAFMIAGYELHHELVGRDQAAGADLLKVLAGIAGGVGFLGAGSIIQNRSNVSGLTTAATTWLAAAIGIACGLGYYQLAAITLVLALLALLLLGLLQRGADYLNGDDDQEDAEDMNGKQPKSSASSRDAS
jgi:putative Mg2+ transporter-C (MgtC) family protein